MSGKNQTASMKTPVNPHDIASKDRQRVPGYLKHADNERSMKEVTAISLLTKRKMSVNKRFLSPIHLKGKTYQVT